LSWVVTSKFKDLETGHVYRVGDKFPHSGRAKKERIEALSTDKNRMKRVLIVKEEMPPKQEQEQETPVEQVFEEKE
jgi:hypothetical protein